MPLKASAKQTAACLTPWLIQHLGAGAAKAPPPAAARRLVALAGPPGAGKSSLAAALVDDLRRQGLGVALLAMDGFHLDDRVLAAQGLLARKGAPETFDLAGFKACLRRLREEARIYVPVFERDQELAVAAAATIGPHDTLVIVEGNYLLFDAPGWRDLTPFWDASVFLNVSLEELQRRLQARWLRQGLSAAAARRKCQDNDLPNARQVLSRRTSSSAPAIALPPEGD